MKKLLIILVLTVPLLAFGQKKRAKQGYYYDLNNKKTEGLFTLVIRAFGKNQHAYLIEYRDGKKVKDQTLNPSTIQSFVLETDSFTIATNFNYDYATKVTKDFVRVISTGKINLYGYRMKSRSAATPIPGVSIQTSPELLVFNKRGSNTYDLINQPTG